MNVLNYRISLDMFDTLSLITIKAKKGDSACQIHITLTEKGKIYNISDGCYATFCGKKADGNFVYDHCKIEGNTIVYDFSSSIDENGICQVTAFEGIVECEVALYKEGKQLTSSRFNLFVDGTVYNGQEILSSTESDIIKEFINKTTIDQTYNPESKNAQSGKAVAEALYTKAPTIINTAEVKAENSWDYTYVHDAIDTPITSVKIKGESTQDTSGGLAPNTPCEIVCAENPTLFVGGWEGDENAQIFTFGGRTLRKLSNTCYDSIVVKDGRVKLTQKVFYKKDFSNVEFASYSNGFTVDITNWGISSYPSLGMCNMLAYASTTSGGTADYYTLNVNTNKLYGRKITERTNGMSVEDWKAKYAADMELLAPLSTPIETDITEQFIEALNLKMHSGQTVMQATNCSSCVVSYYADTKTYIDNAIEKLSLEIQAKMNTEHDAIWSSINELYMAILELKGEI